MSQPEAVRDVDHFIPVINFGPFLSGSSVEKHAVALSITNAFKTSGFLYLKNHGISPSISSEVFSSSARFFARPQEQKDNLSWTTPQANRGYVAYGREKLAGIHDTPRDLKETMEIGREGVEAFPNRWPDRFDDEGEDFKRVMQNFFAACKDLHVQIMRAIAIGLGLPGHFFDKFTDAGDNNLRLLHYPPISKEIFRKNPGQLRAGEHSDLGSVTLLFQDSRDGLQVCTPKGTFVDATPIPDTIVVNAGDLLARWSNDIIKSTRHRVVEPHGLPDDTSNMYPARYSIAYFCHPNLDKFIEVLPGTYGDDLGAKKYSGILCGDYYIQRLSSILSPLY
ncbi:hypothetical protein AX15_000813 [Amanita polypyramis BW_CC]|nr:hypothetical protein AX15_000813 [Amanita polypyramis BW_CC]